MGPARWVRSFERARVADELAIHMLYGCKGSSGIKPCLLCANVFDGKTVRDIDAVDESGLAVYHSEPDFTKLQPMTLGMLEWIIRRFESSRAVFRYKYQHTELERRLGWTFTPDLERRLALAPPPRVLCFDWMHVIFVTGVFNYHMGCLVWCMGGRGITYAAMHAYAGACKWPGRWSKIGKDVFSPKRAESSLKAGHLKCTASEGLCMLPVCMPLCGRRHTLYTAGVCVELGCTPWCVGAGRDE